MCRVGYIVLCAVCKDLVENTSLQRLAQELLPGLVLTEQGHNTAKEVDAIDCEVYCGLDGSQDSDSKRTQQTDQDALTEQLEQFMREDGTWDPDLNDDLKLSDQLEVACSDHVMLSPKAMTTTCQFTQPAAQGDGHTHIPAAYILVDSEEEETPAKRRRMRKKTTRWWKEMGNRKVHVLRDLLALLSSFTHIPSEPDLDGVELFSGVESVRRAFEGQGLRMAAYDMQKSAAHDITMHVGFMMALELVHRTKQGGV